jgi:hypothetical protein
MKNNKKMTTGRSITLKKMSARIPTMLYLKAKFIADSQGMTMEAKIADLLRKDIIYVTSQKWFQDLLQAQDEGNQEFSLFGSNQGKRHTKNKGDLEGSAFEDNFVDGVDDHKE